MRSVAILLLWLTAFTSEAVSAEDILVQEFSGSGYTSTAFFKVRAHWEVRWNSRDVISVAVMSADGSIVAGAAGVLRGSLFVPAEGQYYLSVSDGSASPSAPAKAKAATDKTKDSVPVEATWHLQVVQVASSVDPNQTLSVYTPFFVPPDSALSPPISPVKVPPPALTDEQTRALVTIKGDSAQGFGFMVKSANETLVATSFHLLAANPNVKIFTRSGAPVTILSLKGATDRDLAFYTIQDDHFSYLPIAPENTKILDDGDLLIAPDFGILGNELITRTGSAIDMDQDKINFNIPFGPNNSGAPIIHLKSGKVLALTNARKKIDVSDDLAMAWSANAPTGFFRVDPYFGIRLTGVRGWETIDWTHFQEETLFLKQFHEDTRCLDSYLNSPLQQQNHFRRPDSGALNSTYFNNNAKIRAAQDNYKQWSSGGDKDQELDAARQLLFDLITVADTGMNTLQEMDKLYTYDKNWADEEIVYRKVLRKELDDLSSNISQLDNIARSH